MRGVLQTLHEFGDEGLWTFLLVTVAMAGSAAPISGAIDIRPSACE